MGKLGLQSGSQGRIGSRQTSPFQSVTMELGWRVLAACMPGRHAESSEVVQQNFEHILHNFFDRRETVCCWRLCFRMDVPTGHDAACNVLPHLEGMWLVLDLYWSHLELMMQELVHHKIYARRSQTLHESCHRYIAIYRENIFRYSIYMLSQSWFPPIAQTSLNIPWCYENNIHVWRVII